MGDEYYNIDSILAETQRVQAGFNQDVEGIGWLIGEEDEAKISAGKKVEIPLWLAEGLARFGRDYDYVQLYLPKFLGPRGMANLSAGPTSINLRQLCSYYFTFGMKIVELLDDKKLTQLLRTTYRVRLREIMDRSQIGGDFFQDQGFIEKLDVMEQELLRVGIEATNQFQSWWERSGGELQAASVLRGPAWLAYSERSAGEDS
ncbi:uncharacterized protein VTP21DRAFT_8789 [Calcarisporiella thermophila]|uniref:uncharacterized protein n=1 Tax=Calcarisporiella thermophila TaxID=911321 RepID=UPI0037434689